MINHSLYHRAGYIIKLQKHLTFHQQVFGNAVAYLYDGFIGYSVLWLHITCNGLGHMSTRQIKYRSRRKGSEKSLVGGTIFKKNASTEKQLRRFSFVLLIRRCFILAIKYLNLKDTKVKFLGFI